MSTSSQPWPRPSTPSLLVTNPADIRLLSESALIFWLTKALVFRSSLVLGYDALPPTYGDIKPLDSILKSSIAYNF